MTRSSELDYLLLILASAVCAAGGLIVGVIGSIAISGVLYGTYEYAPIYVALIPAFLGALLPKAICWLVTREGRPDGAQALP